MRCCTELLRYLHFARTNLAYRTPEYAGLSNIIVLDNICSCFRIKKKRYWCHATHSEFATSQEHYWS